MTPSFITWLISKKESLDCLKMAVESLKKPSSSIFLPPVSLSNYITHFFNFLENQKLKNHQFPPLVPSPLSPKVPLSRGTFSFSGPKKIFSPMKILWLWEAESFPFFYRNRLIKLIDRYRSYIFLGIIFSKRNFSDNLATKSDFFLIKNSSMAKIVPEIKINLAKNLFRGEEIPCFPTKFTLKERLALRILWRLRHRATKLEEISSYVYGRRLGKNMHASEVIISKLKRKINYLTGQTNFIQTIKKYGYRIDPRFF